MSNPGRSPTEPVTTRQLELRAVVPDAYFQVENPTQYRKVLTIYKRPGYTQDALRSCDMEERKSFFVPQNQTLAPLYLGGARGPALARTGNGVPSFRSRTSYGKEAQAEFVKLMPEEGSPPPWLRATTLVACAGVALTEGGPENTFGRFQAAYPKRHARIARPPTPAETVAALANVGLSRVPGAGYDPWPLRAAEGDDVMRHNPKADCGLPVAVKWGFPGAAGLCEQLARDLEASFRPVLGRRGGVRDLLREMEDKAPWMVTAVGKAKGDWYPWRKIEHQLMRFYNVVPKQLLLLIQTASQPLERRARTALSVDNATGRTVKSAQGATLTRGGAHLLVGALETQLEFEPQPAYVHVGDDTWLVWENEDSGVLVMFSLDCSNFDLTQHRDATEPIHAALREELRMFDPLSAELWYELMRERQVVLQGTCVYRMRHGGVSGMPLQSKVNGMLMDVVCQRLRQAAAHVDWTRKEAVDEAVQEVGRGLGLAIRLEDHVVTRAGSLAEALEHHPFLFIGYHFYSTLLAPWRRHVRVYADVPRQVPRLPTPNLKWVADRKDLPVVEAMRLGSVVLQLGHPPPCLAAAHQALLDYSVNLIREALKSGDRTDPKLRWAVMENPHGPETEASLSGLLAAVLRGPTAIWEPRGMEGETVHQSRVPVVAELEGQLRDMGWADEMEEVELQESATLALNAGLPENALLVPGTLPGGLRGRAVSLPAKMPTRPLTAANFGRQPPTKVWTEARPPRPPAEMTRRVGEAGPSRSRRGGYAQRAYSDDGGSELPTDDFDPDELLLRWEREVDKADEEEQERREERFLA